MYDCRSRPSPRSIAAVSKAAKQLKLRRSAVEFFGENKVQEAQAKVPDDLQWHLIGHLQSNKAKLAAPFSYDPFGRFAQINAGTG